jgi:hypothetical protein
VRTRLIPTRTTDDRLGLPAESRAAGPGWSDVVVRKAHDVGTQQVLWDGSSRTVGHGRGVRDGQRDTRPCDSGHQSPWSTIR